MVTNIAKKENIVKIGLPGSKILWILRVKLEKFKNDQKLKCSKKF